MKIGDRVRHLRQEKGWILRDLAAQVDVGFTYPKIIKKDEQFTHAEIVQPCLAALGHGIQRRSCERR